MLLKTEKDFLLLYFINSPDNILLLERLIYKFIIINNNIINDIFFNNKINDSNVNELNFNFLYDDYFDSYKYNKFIIDILKLDKFNFNIKILKQTILDVYYILTCKYLIKEFILSNDNNIDLYTGFVIICEKNNFNYNLLKCYNNCDICNKKNCSYLVIDKKQIKKIILNNVLICINCINIDNINNYCNKCNDKIKNFKNNIFTQYSKEKIYNMFIEDCNIVRKCIDCF